MLKKAVLSNILSPLISLALFIIILRRPLYGVFEVEALNLVDELFVSATIILGFLIPLITLKISRLFLLMIFLILYLIGISFLFGLNQNAQSIVLQTVLHMKFFIILWILLLLNKRNHKMLSMVLKWLIFFAFLSYFAELFFGKYFLGMFNLEKTTRNNLDRISGFFHPNQLSLIFLLWFYKYFNSSSIRAKPDMLILTILLVSIIIVSIGSRTTLIGLILFLIMYYWKKIIANGRVFLVFGILGVFGLLLVYVKTNFFEITFDNISNGFNIQGHYIRGIMLHLSVILSWQYFPIGSGSGTFGSLYSKGSVVYEDFGVAERSYFRDMIGIYDSNFATILGEFGIIGLLFFGYLTFQFYKCCIKKANKDDLSQLMIKLIFIFIAINSFVNPTFTNSAFSVIIPIFLVNYLNEGS